MEEQNMTNQEEVTGNIIDNEETQQLPAEDESQEVNESRNSEAAKRRKQLRAVEADHKALQESHSALQAKHNELLKALIETHLSIPGAILWDTGVDVADLVNESGVPDPEKVREAQEVAAQRYNVRPAARRPKPVPEAGASAPYQGGLSWSDALKS